MRLRGSMKSIESFSSNIKRGGKAECQLCRSKVIVNGLRHSQNRKAKAVKFCCNAQRAFAADDDQAFNVQLFQVGDRLLVNLLNFSGRALGESSAITSAEDRAAAR